MNKRAVAIGVLVAGFLVVWAISQWRQVADLRAHGVEVTAKVVTVVRSGKAHQVLLELPRPGGGTTETWMDVQPLSKVAEGNLIEVTYDPARPDRLQRGWGIDYATPIVVTAAAVVATAVVAVRPAALFRRGQAAPPPPRRRKRPAKRKRTRRRP